MLVVPIQAVENSYIPPPGVISYITLGLFILENWQIYLHSQTSSCSSCLDALPRPSSHGQLMGTPLASTIWTPSSWRGRSTGSVSQQSWGALSSTSSSTSTQMLRISILLLNPRITHFFFSQLYFGSIFLQVSHLLFDVVCCCGGLVCLCCSSGVSWPPGLSSPFHNGICNGSTTFLARTHHHFHLSLSLSPIDWAIQVESNIPFVTKRKPLFEQLSTQKIWSSPQGPRPLLL